MSDSDSEVIVNVKCKLCTKCNRVFKSSKQLMSHERHCNAAGKCKVEPQEIIDHDTQSNACGSESANMAHLKPKDPSSCTKSNTTIKECSRNRHKREKPDVSQVKTSFQDKKDGNQGKLKQHSVHFIDSCYGDKLNTSISGSENQRNKTTGNVAKNSKGLAKTEHAAENVEISRCRSSNIKNKQNPSAAEVKKPKCITETFKCDLCNKTYATRMGYTQHLKKMHGTVPETDVSSLHKTLDRRLSSENLLTSPDTPKGGEEVKKPESSGLSDKIPCIETEVVDSGLHNVTGTCNQQNRDISTEKATIPKYFNYKLKTSYKFRNKYRQNTKRVHKSGEVTVSKQSKSTQRCICPVCGKSFEFRNLLNHCNRCHNGKGYMKVVRQREKRKKQLMAKRTQECLICDKRYRRCDDLKTHCIQAHEGYGYKDAEVIRKEKEDYLKKPFVCTKCDKRYKKRYNLKEHWHKFHKYDVMELEYKDPEMIRKAQEEYLKKPNACMKCNKRYKRRFSLKDHYRKYHGSDLQSQVATGNTANTIVNNFTPSDTNRKQTIETFDKYSNKLIEKEQDVNSLGTENKNDIAPLSIAGTDSLHERLVISLNTYQSSTKKSNFGFMNFKITLQKPSNQGKIVRVISETALEETRDVQTSEKSLTRENETATQNDRTKIQDKGKRRSNSLSNLETHIMDPLGAQPSDVVPVQLLGKSCISINSPKMLKPHQTPKEMPEKSDSESSADNLKICRISQQSLAKRFERNTSVVLKKISEGKSDVNTKNDLFKQKELKQSDHVDDKETSVSNQSTVDKGQVKAKRRSPKVVLERLTNISGLEEAVNVKDIPQNEPVSREVSHTGICESLSLSENQYEESLTEDEEYDEEQAIIVAKQVADLRKIIMAKRSKKCKGLFQMQEVQNNIFSQRSSVETLKNKENISDNKKTDYDAQEEQTNEDRIDSQLELNDNRPADLKEGSDTYEGKCLSQKTKKFMKTTELCSDSLEETSLAADYYNEGMSFTNNISDNTYGNDVVQVNKDRTVSDQLPAEDMNSGVGTNVTDYKENEGCTSVDSHFLNISTCVSKRKCTPMELKVKWPPKKLKELPIGQKGKKKSEHKRKNSSLKCAQLVSSVGHLDADSGMLEDETNITLDSETGNEIRKKDDNKIINQENGRIALDTAEKVQSLCTNNTCATIKIKSQTKTTVERDNREKHQLKILPSTRKIKRVHTTSKNKLLLDSSKEFCLDRNQNVMDEETIPTEPADSDYNYTPEAMHVESDLLPNQEDETTPSSSQCAEMGSSQADSCELTSGIKNNLEVFMNSADIESDNTKSLNSMESCMVNIQEIQNDVMEKSHKENPADKALFKILKLNWNPCFSDKELVPLENCELVESENEKVAKFPKIIRYVCDTSKSENDKLDICSSLDCLTNIMPHMNKMLTKNGTNLNGAFVDLTMLTFHEGMEDSFDIDYGLSEKSDGFLNLAQLLGERNLQTFICHCCGEIVHGQSKFLHHANNCKEAVKTDYVNTNLASKTVSEGALHEANKFECDICGCKYKWEKTLKHHLKHRHPAEERTRNLKKKIQDLNKKLEIFVDKTSLSEVKVPTSENFNTSVIESEDNYVNSSLPETCDLVQYVAEPLPCTTPQGIKPLDTLLLSNQNDCNNSTFVSSYMQSFPGKLTESSNADLLNSQSSLGKNKDFSDSVNKSLVNVTSENSAIEHNVDCIDDITFESVKDSDNICQTQYSVEEVSDTTHTSVLKTPDKCSRSSPEPSQELEMTPDQNLFESDSTLNSPSRKLDFLNNDSAINEKVLTLNDVRKMYKGFLMECKVVLAKIDLTKTKERIGNINVVQMGNCRWKIEDKETITYSHDKSLSVNCQNFPTSFQGNDFDVNCPTYEIEYFPESSSQLDTSCCSNQMDQTLHTIHTSSFNSQLSQINSDDNISETHKKNLSESDTSSVISNRSDLKITKTKPRKERFRTDIPQSSPKKDLTDFERAISQTKEVKKKRKFERTPSKDDSNSHDGLDFLKKVNERNASTTKTENYYQTSKLARSIINKKAKKSQENVVIAPCGIEDIEPFEAVLASKDKVKKSPVKKIRKPNTDSLFVSKRSITLDDSSTSDGRKVVAKSNESDITHSKSIGDEPVLEGVDLGTTFEMIEQGPGLEQKSQFLLSSSDRILSKSKEKQSLSDRFGALDKRSDMDVSKSSNKDFRNMSSEEVMKSMFGTGAFKFGRTFRKQPGMETNDTSISLKSPLASIERTNKGTSRLVPELKQSVVVATERKQPASKKKHFLNMLKGLMDSPEEKSILGNRSLNSPQHTGIFTDTESVRTVVTAQIDQSFDSLNVDPIPQTPVMNASVFMEATKQTEGSEKDGSSCGTHVETDNTQYKRLESDVMSVSTKSTEIQKTVEAIIDRQVISQCTNSDVSHVDTLTKVDQCSNSSKSSSFSRKRFATVPSSQPKKKVRLERLPIPDSRSENRDTVTNFETLSASTENDSTMVLSELESDHLCRNKTDGLLQPTNTVTRLEQDVSDDEFQYKEIESAEVSKTGLVMEDFETSDDYTCFNGNGKKLVENLMSALEPESVMLKQTEENNKEMNHAGFEQLQPCISILSPVTKFNVDHSPVSSVASKDIEDENKEERSDNEEEESGSDREINSESDEDSNDSNEPSNKGSDEESTDESSIETDSDDKEDKESESEDGENSYDGSNKEDDGDENEIQERTILLKEKDHFSSMGTKANKSDLDMDNCNDDAISIMVDFNEFETASFLIAKDDEEEERMNSVDRELQEINSQRNTDSDMDLCDLNSDAGRIEVNVRTTNNNSAQTLSNYKGPYPPGYCFQYLRQKCTKNKSCPFKHFEPQPVELYHACVKGISESCGKNDAKKAFDIYNNLLQLKVALTPCETLKQLLRVAENNWNIRAAFSLLDDLNDQSMVTAEVCEMLIRLCGQRPEFYRPYLWKLFEIILRSRRIQLSPDSVTVLLRSFADHTDMTYIWHVIVQAKFWHLRTVPEHVMYRIIANSLENPDPYCQYMENWVMLCEPHLLQQMDSNLRSRMIHLFRIRHLIECEKKLEDASGYPNFQQKFGDNNQVSTHPQESVVILKDYIKTTDNYKALYHKIQSCYHTKNWTLLGSTFVELCQQGELDNSYYIDAYALVFLTNVKSSTQLVDAFNKFMISLSRQYLEESQEDVLAKFDSRSLSYIGNRLLYACQEKQWWIEGHNLMQILIKNLVPFYRYSEIGKTLSCVTAMNICLHVKDVVTAYSIHLHYGWDSQTMLSLQDLKQEVEVLHDLFDQLLLYSKPREALKVLGSCLDIIDNNPELNEYYDFIEDFNSLIITALDCGDLHAGCWAFKLHSTAQVSKDLDRRTLRALLTACGENNFLTEAKELYKICKSKGVYPIQVIEMPRTVLLTTAMTYFEIKMEIESYLEWVYRYLCEIQMEGKILEISHFFVRVHIERIIDPVAYKMPYLCRVPRTETAAYNMVLNLFLDEFGMDGKIVFENNTWFIYILTEHVKKYLEKLDSNLLRQGFRIRGFARPIKKV